MEALTSILPFAIPLLVIPVLEYLKTHQPKFFDTNGPITFTWSTVLNSVGQWAAAYVTNHPITPEQQTLYSALSTLASTLLHQIWVTIPSKAQVVEPPPKTAGTIASVEPPPTTTP